MVGEVEHKTSNVLKEKTSYRSEFKSNFRLFMAQQVDPYEGMDAYQILGISRDSDAKTIKAAFRKGMIKFYITIVPQLLTLSYSMYSCCEVSSRQSAQ